MPKITKIVRQKRDKSRVSVFIDEEFAFGLDEAQLLALHIHIGEELGPERRRELEQGALLSSAKNTAQRYLGRSMRTSQEVRKKLKEKEYPQATIESVIEWLTGYGFLNDAEYARAYIRTQQRLKPSGRSRLFQDLLRKGIAREMAEDALSEYVDDASDYNTALELAQTYVRKNARIEPEKLKQRLVGFLQRRGFRGNDVFRAISEAMHSSADE